jgi:hypothetical protein
MCGVSTTLDMVGSDGSTPGLVFVDIESGTGDAPISQRARVHRIRIPFDFGHVAQAFDRAARYGLGNEHAWAHGNSRRREISARSLSLDAETAF